MNDKEIILKIIRQLDAWANQSLGGGWSTHQVEPQRKLADELSRYIRTGEQPKSLDNLW